MKSGLNQYRSSNLIREPQGGTARRCKVCSHTHCRGCQWHSRNRLSRPYKTLIIRESFERIIYANHLNTHHCQTHPSRLNLWELSRTEQNWEELSSKLSGWSAINKLTISKKLFAEWQCVCLATSREVALDTEISWFNCKCVLDWIFWIRNWLGN